MTAVGVLVLLTVDESETYERTDTDDLSLRRTILIVRQTLSQRNIRAFVLYYYVLYAAVTYLVFVFLQPIFETVVLDLGVSQSRVKSLLGWFYATYSLFGAGLSYYTGAIRARLGLRTWFLWLPFIVGGALIGMYFVPVLALPTFLLIRGLSDVTRSFAGQYINDRIGTMGRATVLSAMAMVSGLAVVPFQLGSGILSDVASPLFALAVAGGVLVVGATGCCFGRHRSSGDDRYPSIRESAHSQLLYEPPRMHARMRTSFSIPDPTVEEFDQVWQDQGLDNRSRAVREAMQEYIESHSRLEELTADVVALVAFDYRHHEVIGELHGVQHEYQDVILNTSHTHQGEWCLESVYCQGGGERVRELTYRLRNFDGVNRVKVMIIRDN